MRRLVLPTLAAALALAGAPAQAADHTVNATSSSTFSPSSVTIAVDDTVTWKNQGGIHNVEFDDGSYTQPATPNVARRRARATIVGRSRRARNVRTTSAPSARHEAASATLSKRPKAVGLSSM